MPQEPQPLEPPPRATHHAVGVFVAAALFVTLGIGFLCGWSVDKFGSAPASAVEDIVDLCQRDAALLQDRCIALQTALGAPLDSDFAFEGCSGGGDDRRLCAVGNNILGTGGAMAAVEPSGQRRGSALPECQATRGPREDPNFLDAARPCGTLSSICPDLPVVEANKDYPGGGVGAVVPNQDYIVQFDVGLHPVVARDIFKRRLKEFESCVHCPQFEERCLEMIVTGGAMWGDLGIGALGAKAYDCMGGCGAGCSTQFSATHKDMGALDCLKHDVCSAWKSVATGEPTRGFCHDPDCGDEAAMTIFNCWRGWRFFGALGGSRGGPFSEPAVCEPDPQVTGCWSHSGWFTQGRCKAFQGWERGQGIPDPDPFRGPIQRL